MGKLKAFEIRLDDNKVVYYPGDELRGNLFVRLDSPMEAKEIKITFRGRAYVHWTEEEQRGTGDNARTVTVHYRNSQKFFDHSIKVFGKESGENRNTIPQGEHPYGFSYKLPAPLPSSYEDDIGHIRYDITASIDRPWKFDKKTRRAVTVLDVLDLNQVENALQPAVGTETKYLCCWCCKSGPIKAKFEADRSAYVPGEFVTINASLKNGSNSKVKATSASLMQKLSYRSPRRTKIRWNTIVQVSGKECRKGKTVEWSNERLQIPPVPPTEKTHCAVLDIEYYLMFQGHLRRCATDLREFEEIIIGTVPHMSLRMYQNQAAQESDVPSAPEPEVILPSVAVNDPQSQTSVPVPGPPRPIYKTPDGGQVNLAAEDDGGKLIGESVYSPQYTFYDWSQSAFTY